MSHHLDSPLTRRDSRLNITDQYVFGATGATVFVLNADTSLAGNENPSRFHPEGRYEIKVHVDDAPDEALTFRFTFAEANGDGHQDFVVERLTGAAATDDTVDGQVLVCGRTGETAPLPSGGRVWAGRAADPFYLDLSFGVHPDRPENTEAPCGRASSAACSSSADLPIPGSPRTRSAASARSMPSSSAWIRVHSPSLPTSGTRGLPRNHDPGRRYPPVARTGRYGPVLDHSVGGSPISSTVLPGGRRKEAPLSNASRPRSRGKTAATVMRSSPSSISRASAVSAARSGVTTKKYAFTP